MFTLVAKHCRHFAVFSGKHKNQTNSYRSVDILSDILTASTLPSHEIERERGVIIQEIGQSLDTPDDLVFERS